MLYKCVRSSCKIPILVTSLKNKELLSKDQTTYTLQTSKVNHYGIVFKVGSLSELAITTNKPSKFKQVVAIKPEISQSRVYCTNY